MKYSLNNDKWESVKIYLNKLWTNPQDYPDKGLVLSLSDKEISGLFTKKRLELVKLIQSRKPKNVTVLSKLVGRRLTAVLRDLELLKNFHVIELHRQGKNIVPIVIKEILILPLVKIETKQLAQIAVRTK